MVGWALQMWQCIIPDVNVFTYLSIIIDCIISAPGHGRELVDGINATNTSFLFQLLSTVQLPDAKIYDTQMIMQTKTRTSNVSLAIEFKNHLSTAARKMEWFIKSDTKKGR